MKKSKVTTQRPRTEAAFLVLSEQKAHAVLLLFNFKPISLTPSRDVTSRTWVQKNGN